jgi:integrase
MPRRRSLSDLRVAGLRPRADRYAEPDPELRGHYVRVHPSGAKSFVAVARDPNGKQVWATLGSTDLLGIDDARTRARSAIERIRAGLPAFETQSRGGSFGEVAANWIKRHVEANGLRSRRKIEGLLANHVLPTWGERKFLGIRKSDVAALLDDVEDNHSPRQADMVLTIVRSMMGWFSTRHDDYTPPIVRGMRRTDPKAQARKRILADNELRAIWKEASGTFGGIIKTCLLTAQRRSKVATMRWEDVVDGEWTIPREPREKETAGTLVLPDAVLDILRSQSRIGSNPYVFPGRGDGPFTSWDGGKRALDAKLPSVSSWVIQDCRRTARSLMARAGVRPDIAERVMGHAVGGVEGIYDRHSYRDEKHDALKRLAELVENIVSPPPSNVVHFRGAAR